MGRIISSYIHTQTVALVSFNLVRTIVNVVKGLHNIRNRSRSTRFFQAVLFLIGFH